MRFKPFSIIFSLVFALTLALFTGCSFFGSDVVFPDGSQVAGIAPPFQLQGDQSVLHLSDYFINAAAIDSITGREEFEFVLDKANDMLLIKTSGEIPYFSEMKAWTGGLSYSILLQKSRKINYRFVFDPKGQSYSTVYIAGDMNNWNRTSNPLMYLDGVWQCQLLLNPGEYQYLLVLDGVETTDPSNPEIADNNIGGYNSLLRVGNILLTGTPSLIPLQAGKRKVKIGLVNHPEKVFVFWQNYRLPAELLSRTSDELTVYIPKQASSLERSFLRLWSFNQQGVSNNLLIPLHHGKVLMSPGQLTPNDKEAAILYFLMVDRFFNGNPGNDHPIDDPEILPPANYWGGDLAGITAKLSEGYFEKLGVNAIWLSPITQNPLKGYVEFPEPRRKFSGYHGYWPVTLTTIDNRFGNSEEMHNLVALAHQQGINILLDYVSNHVHQENQLIKDHPDWATQLHLPDGRLNIRLWDEQRLTTWFDTFMPSLDFEKPEVVETISDSALFWIREYNLDGFRHDATKHIPEIYWRRLTRKLKEQIIIPEGKRLYQIGETFGSRELIGSYVSAGQLDGQFDFNLYFDARSVFALDSESFMRMNQSLKQSFAYYGTQHLMGNITGNHDLPRFISFAGEGLRFDEDEKAAAWNRRVEVENPAGYQKLTSLVAFIMTIPGVPVIYYGDEIGMAGAGDPDSRRPMKFDSLNHHERSTFETVARLVNLRRNHLSLIYGDFNVLHVDDHTWVYSRRYFDDAAIVVFNKANTDRTVQFELPDGFVMARLKPAFGNNPEHNKGNVKIHMKPYSFEILVK